MDTKQFFKKSMETGLYSEELFDDPLKQFELWYKETNQTDIHEPTAMSIATVDEQGNPWQRIVLLKAFDERGFVFFTNYESRKANHIASNANVSLLFPWYSLGRQLQITGRAKKISSEESLEYFATRPRGSQLGAWASEQSRIIESRTALEKAVENIEIKFANNEVPLPTFWGGYRITPTSYEFWQARDNRLHDRFIYKKDANDVWQRNRYAP